MTKHVALHKFWFLTRSQHFFSVFAICMGASFDLSSFGVCHLDRVISYFVTGLYEFFAWRTQLDACHLGTSWLVLSFHEYCFRGCDPDVTNNDKHTSLHLAIGNGHLKIVKQLLHRWGASQGEDSEGNTPIVLAARQGFPEIVDFLASSNGQEAKNR